MSREQTIHIYLGTRVDGHRGRTVVTADGERLPPRNDLFNHSPDGFEWGYGGSGPAQLALAILAHHLGSVIVKSHAKSVAAVDAAAVRLHQKFKWEFVARWGNEWILTSDEIDAWLGRTMDREVIKGSDLLAVINEIIDDG